jgi:hypothetical protein
MDVVQTIEQARAELSGGSAKTAARLLTEAAYATTDPELERQIARLAEEGRAMSGPFGRGRWKEIIRVAKLRAEKADVAA